MNCRRHPLLGAFGLVLLGGALISCGSTYPNSARVLLSVAVTPTTADAQTFPNGQVVFTATGTFSIQPSPAVLTFTAPYAGQFDVGTVNNQVIATVVATGSGTATVQCVSGMSGSVTISASAFANNGTSTTVTGFAQLTCP